MLQPKVQKGAASEIEWQGGDNKELSEFN